MASTLSLLNTRKLRLPSIASCEAPGPVMVRGALTSSSPLVSVMAPVTAGSNTMASASGFALAAATASRKVPAPESPVFVTVKVAASSGLVMARTAPSVRTPRPCVRCARKRGLEGARNGLGDTVGLE